MSPRPTLALLTDFGLQDHYVGVMKGVIARLCPEANIIDISHGVPPQDVMTAAFELAAAAPYFPADTVFLAVVDPGVGTSRRAIAAQVGAQRFVGPDNGVFDLVFRRQTPTLVVELDASVVDRPAVGRTFEGRDRFAPAAASLARGRSLESLGRRGSVVPRLAWPEPRRHEHGIEGEVIHVDHFGNLVTNIERQQAEDLLPLSDVMIATHGPARVVNAYGEAPTGALVALFSSTDRLEVAVVSGEAASRLGVGRGAPVLLRRRA